MTYDIIKGVLTFVIVFGCIFMFIHDIGSEFNKGPNNDKED